MDLWQLRYFVATVDEGNYGRAAARLNVSQPSITRAIQALEAELGVELLRRGRGGFGLTEAGTAFVAEARRLLDDASGAMDLARRAARGEAGAIAIGFEASIVLSTIPALAARYRESHPEVVLQLMEMDTLAQVAALLDRRIDLGVVGPIAPDERIHCVEFVRERLFAAVAAGHALAGLASVGLEQLAGQPMVTSSHGGGCGLHSRIAGAFGRVGQTLTPAADVNDTQLALDFVAAGIGIAVVPASVVARGHTGVAFVPVLPEEIVTYSLIWLRDNDRSSVLRFQDYLKVFLAQAALTES